MKPGLYHNLRSPYIYRDVDRLSMTLLAERDLNIFKIFFIRKKEGTLPTTKCCHTGTADLVHLLT
jgi:hypothetical protein